MYINNKLIDNYTVPQMAKKHVFVSMTRTNNIVRS